MALKIIAATKTFA